MGLSASQPWPYRNPWASPRAPMRAFRSFKLQRRGVRCTMWVDTLFTPNRRIHLHFLRRIWADGTFLVCRYHLQLRRQDSRKQHLRKFHRSGRSSAYLGHLHVGICQQYHPESRQHHFFETFDWGEGYIGDDAELASRVDCGRGVRIGAIGPSFFVVWSGCSTVAKDHEHTVSLSKGQY